MNANLLRFIRGDFEDEIWQIVVSAKLFIALQLCARLSVCLPAPTGPDLADEITFKYLSPADDKEDSKLVRKREGC